MFRDRHSRNKWQQLQASSKTPVLAKKKIWDINDHRSQEIHYLIGEMIAVDIQPYSVTSDIGFNRLIAKLCSNYRIPSKKYFTKKIIPDIFPKVKTKIQLSVDEISSIYLTTVTWYAPERGKVGLCLGV